MLSLLATCSPAVSLRAQWDLQQSGTAANLRGIANVDGEVAWASGAGGTVLRTTDGGRRWQACAVPPGAATLDLRAVQAFDDQTALVMSAGPGTASRIFRTADGCRSWKLLLTNDQPAGFWDAMRFHDRTHGVLLGDPVSGHFVVLTTSDAGTTWQTNAAAPVDDAAGQGAFAASNSSLQPEAAGGWSFCTGGPAGPHLWQQLARPGSEVRAQGAGGLARESSSEELRSNSKGDSAGCFSLATDGNITVAVGGDYKHPEIAEDNAWTTRIDPQEKGAAAEGRQHPLFRFVPSQTKPGGYRSAVAYDAHTRTWIAVGPTGTDVSADGAVHWRSLQPQPSQPPNSDRDWNALSLPYVVGPHGRIGKLRPDALRSAAAPPAK